MIFRAFLSRTVPPFDGNLNFAEQLLDSVNHMLGSKPGAESLHPDDAAVSGNIPLPPKRRSLLDGNARCHSVGQHAVPVFLGLALEDVPGRHGDHARANALRHELFVRLRGEADLAA
jgi:hypothetical protein